ncbi:hypothetical protein ACP4OV_019978 [Aristida adscensionis]
MCRHRRRIDVAEMAYYLHGGSFSQYVGHGQRHMIEQGMVVLEAVGGGGRGGGGGGGNDRGGGFWPPWPSLAF